MCFAPQRRALFRHLNFENCSENGVLCTFWLRHVLRTTAACNFSSLICPAGSAPAALASLLLDPPEPQIIGKTQCFATFLPFRAPASSVFWLFLFSDLLSSSPLFSSLTFGAVAMTTFGSCDVEKVHAVVARSTFRSQNVQSITCSRHFWRFRCRFASLHYITLHYTPLHHTPLHYTTLHNSTTTTTQLHSTTLHYTTLHCTTLHYTPLHYITLHCTTFHYTSLRYTTLHYNYNYNCATTLHYKTLHYTKLHYTTLHYTTLRSTTPHYITLHYLPLHYTTLHSSTQQLQLRLHNYTPLHEITLHYITLRYITLNDTAPQIDR